MLHVKKQQWQQIFPFIHEIENREWEQANPHTAMVPKEKIVLMEGDSIPFVPLVLSGSIRVYKMSEQGREVTLYRVKKGEACVLMVTSILGEEPYPAYAVVEEDAEVLILPVHAFLDWIRLYPTFQQFVYKLISKRLLTVMTLVEEFVFQRVDERMADYLLQHTTEENQTIEMTQEALAKEIGTAREVVSRVLKSFSKQNLVRVNRGTIEVIDREQLHNYF